MPIDDSRVVVYVVTARHVVENSRPHGALYIRAALKAGSAADFKTNHDSWRSHPSSDVAAILAGDPSELALQPVPLHLVATDDWVRSNEVGEGDDLFFVGLFAQHPGREQIQPVVRFGNIALMPREPVLVTTATGSARMDAYLAEARSWGGQSGSPVFILDHPYRDPSLRIALLGLVSGHFDIEERLAISGDLAELGSAKVPINAGMAIVMPGQKIHELLMDDELAERRKAMVRGPN